MADVYLYISQKKKFQHCDFSKKKKDFFFFYYRNISQLNSASALLLSKPSLLRSGWPSLLRSGWSSALLLLLQSPGSSQSHISATSGLFFCWSLFFSGSSVLFATFFTFFLSCGDTSIRTEVGGSTF